MYCGTPTGVATTGASASKVAEARVEVFQAAERARAAQHFGDAIRLYQQVVTVDPGNARAWFGLAKALAASGQPAKALGAVERSLGLAPQAPDARQLRDALERATPPRGPGETGDATVREMLRRAVDCLASGRHSDALAILDSILGAAAPAFAAAREAAPLHTYRATCLASTGRTSEGLEAADAALRCDDGYARAWARKGDILDDLGRPREALAAFERAVQLDDGDARAWCDRGYVLRKLGRVADAVASYDRSLTIDARNPIAWNNKGNALVELERYDDAAYCFDRALAIDPKLDAARGALQGLVARGLLAGPGPAAIGSAGTRSAGDWAGVAKHFVERIGEEAGLALDYSEASLRALDLFLDIAFPGHADPDDHWQPTEAERGVIVGAGAYLGETARRLVGGVWMDGRNDNPAPYSTGLVVAARGAEIAMLPFMRVMKRLKYGDERLQPYFAELRVKMGSSPTAAEAQAWVIHAARVADNRMLDEALAMLRHALGLDPRNEDAQRVRLLVETDLGMKPRTDGKPALPPGVPGPTMLEAMASGGPAVMFAFHAVTELVPADNLLVVSWQLDVPLTLAKKWDARELVTSGVRADGITRARRVVCGCFEASASEIPVATIAATLGGWAALLESGRIESVSFIGNRPWSASATERIDDINRRLEHSLVPVGRRITVTTLDDDED
jgi:tetratricopeptide (TPR) repeat protein